MTERPKQPGTPPPDPPDDEQLSEAGDASPESELPTQTPAKPLGLDEMAAARPDTFTMPERIGSYRIEGIIGHGGMGTVFKALQESPRRTVALKVIKQGVASRSTLKRFEYEAQILGRLRHENIAQIYEAGTHDDGSGALPYFAMEYIAGARSITDYAQEKKLGTRDRLALFAKVCDAIQHGHQKGIIHRDLKPGNILVTSSGVPKIIDFGVARSTDSDMAVTTLRTDIGQLVGTLQYMSPEQCEADPHDIDTRSDVYALGVVLYELLVGRMPYSIKDAAIHEAVRIIREEEPTKLSTLDRHLRGDVEIITLKALEKDRDRRYQSAVELEQDIERYLAGEPITAKAPTALDYLRRFARKHKAAATVIVSVFVVLVVAVIAISIFAASAERARELAQEQQRVAEVARAEADEQRIAADTAKQEAQRGRDEARQQAYYGNIAAAAAAIDSNDIYNAQRRLEAAKAVAPSGDGELPFEWRYLDGRADDSLTTIRRVPGQVSLLAVSPDKKRLAYTTDPEKDNRIYISTLQDDGNSLAANELVLPGHEWEVADIVFSPDGMRLASIGISDKLIHTWDATTGENLATMKGEFYFSVLVFSPDGSRLFAGSKDSMIHSWDTTSGEEFAPFEGHEDWISALACSPDGTRLASASFDGVLRAWDIETGDMVFERTDGLGRPASLAFSPGNSRLIVGGTDGTIRIVDADNGELLHELRGHRTPVTSLACSSDGTLLASSAGSGWVFDDMGVVRLWDLHSGEEVAVLRGHKDVITGLSFSLDGATLYTGSMDGTIRTWDTGSRKDLDTLAVYQGFTGWGVIHFSPDGSRLVSAGSHSADFAIRIWDSNTNVLLAQLPGHTDNINWLALSPDGSRLASSSHDQTIRIWDMDTGEELMVLPGHQSAVYALDFSPDGSLLASGDGDGAVRIWDPPEYRELQAPRGNEAMVSTVAFSPEGSRLLVSSFLGSIRAWDVDTGEELPPIVEEEENVGGFFFNPEGTRIASTNLTDRTHGGDFPIHLRDAFTGDILSTYHGNNSNVSQIQFNSDGSRLVSCSYNGALLVWDTATGESVLSLLRDQDQQHATWWLTFSPDEQRLVVLLSSQRKEGDSAGPRFSSKIQSFDTRPMSVIARSRRAATERAAQLAPLVEGWVEKGDGDDELVVAMLEREVKNRPPEEQATLRNLVLKKLVQRRQEEAKEAEAAQPTVP